LSRRLPPSLRLAPIASALLCFLPLACSSGQADGGLPYAGRCTLTAAAITGQPSYYSAHAEFGTPTTAPAFCQGGQSSGSCCLYTGGGPDGGNIAGPGLSAGTLNATDGITPVATMTFNSGTSEYPEVVNANAWGPGDTLKWSGNGEYAGAFEGSVTATAMISGLNPDPSAYPTGVVIQRNADFTVSWNPDAVVSGASMELDLSVGMPVEFSSLIVCRVPDSAGALTVPTAPLSQLQAGGVGYILFQRQNKASTAGHNVSVDLISAATSFGSATFP